MDELCDGPLVVNEVAPSPCASGLPDEVLTTDCEGNLALRTVEACKARYDWELACLSDGGTTVPGVAVYDMFDPQNPVVTLYVGGTDVTATHTIVPCPSDDRELVETCFQDITDPSIRYTRVTVVDLSAGAVVVETFWLDATGAVVAAPANVEPCAEQKQTLADHQFGCIKRLTGEELACSSTTQTFSFAQTDLITATVISKDGLGNFTIEQETTVAAHASWLALMAAVTQSNARTVEDLGPGLLNFFFHEGSLSNIVDVSPTVVRYDLHVEPGVSDIPGALIAPCVDPITDQQYADSAATLFAGFDGQTVGVPFPNGLGADFVVTQYAQVPSGGVYEYISAKQVVTYDIDGNPVSDKYFVPGTLEEIFFNPLTDTFGRECADLPVADIVECVTAVGANVVTEATDNNIEAAAAVVVGGSALTTFHPALDVPITLTGNASFGAMGAGINVNVQTAITGAVFTYNFDFISDTDPGDPADFGIVVWDNNLGASIAATSIVTSLSSIVDVQGTGLNYPLYAIPNPIINPYTITWTGDLPVGDYSVLFTSQNQGASDQTTLLLEYVLPPSGAAVTTRAELVALDYCTKQELIAALAPLPIVETQLTSQILNASGVNVVATGFKSVSVTALSADVTIDGQPIPQGFSWSVDSAENERYNDTVTVNGSGYILTEVR